MKRIALSILVALIVMMTLGSTVISAKGPDKGPPDSIIIMAGYGPTFNLAGTDGVPPPEVFIVLKDGRIIRAGPPDK